MSQSRANLLIVDDEPNIRQGLAKGLAQCAQRVDTSGDAEEALERIDAQKYHLVIADVRLPGRLNGIELIAEIAKRSPSTATIAITAHGTIETAVEAMRLGALDFISKPIDLNLIRHQVSKALEHISVLEENRELRSRLADVRETAGIIGASEAIRRILEQVRQVAQTDATTLITGETGSGKELIARALHDLSARKDGPFVAVNLGAMPESLLETELFGHEKGAFTGAIRQKMGCFERASDGALFLDEITEMSPKSQIDLLRVLETGQYTRVGGESVLRSNCRIISATNRDMNALVQSGEFREDLYYRLHIVPIAIPALRERRDDIPLLAEHYLELFCNVHKRPRKRFSEEALQRMSDARWPGNIRQLRNVIERMVITTPGDRLLVENLPPELSAIKPPQNDPLLTLAEATESAEKQAIQRALNAADFHREKTATILGISVRSLHYKMSRYGIG